MSWDKQLQVKYIKPVEFGQPAETLKGHAEDQRPAQSGRLPGSGGLACIQRNVVALGSNRVGNEEGS